MNEFTPQSKPRDLYQEVTDKIIAALESGTTPWQQPWKNVNLGALRNGVSRKPYRGINTLLLYVSGMVNHRADPRYVSFKQCQQNGWKVKKGAKSERVYFFKPMMVDERDSASGLPVIDAATGKPRQKQIPYLQTTPVFNAEDIEGIPQIVAGEENFTPIEAGEALIQRCPVPIHYGGNRAFYNPKDDVITMPPKAQFEHAEDFYSVAAHEMLHMAGSSTPKRLCREFGKRFGDDAYAFEELVAEIGSLTISNSCGLPAKIDNHASYIEHWLKVLRQDKKAIFLAAAKAGEAVDYLMGKPQLDATAEVNPESPPAKSPSEKPAAVVGTPVKVPLADVVSIPAIAVVAKIKERRAKEAAANPSAKRPTLGH